MIRYKKFKNNNNSQVIALMGIILVVSVFAISSIAADLANIDIELSSKKSISLLNEYIIIKDAFGKSLNYNLTDKSKEDTLNDRYLFYGNISNINDKFKDTVDIFYQMEIKHDIFFNAVLNDWYVAHPGSTDGIYYLNVTLTLENRETRFVEDLTYSIICLPYVT